MRADDIRLQRLLAAARALALGLPLLVGSCVLPGVDKAPLATVPLARPPAKPAVDTSVTPEHKRLVAVFGGEYHAPAAERLLNGVLARLAPASDVPGEPYKVTLLNSPVVNAFALPSGNIYVTP